jgi:AcrR family transcriptional regulator
MVDPVKRATKPDSAPRRTRAEQARDTRRRIVAAAAEHFVAHGYGATLLDQVAEQAGVAVQTVYFHFGNKRTLLKHVMDVAAVGDDEPVPLLERPWFQQLQQEPDPRRIIARWLAGSREIVHRVAPLMRVMLRASGTDPELAAQWEANQQQTRAAYGILVQLLDARGGLRPDLDVEQARDIAFTLGNVETYLQFTEVCGWTPDQWQDRTATLLTATLLAPADHSRRAGPP